MNGLNLEDFLDEVIECGWRPTHDPGNKKITALWKSWQSDGYDASCIKILQFEEIEERFPWERIESLAHQYKRDAKWIEAGIEACRTVSVDPDYFIERYLNGNREIPKNQLVIDAYLEITKGKDND